MKFLKIIFIFSIFIFAAFSSVAEEDKIAAIVNGEEISSYTLKHRVDLAIRSSGLPDTAEVQNKVRPQVLEILVDEKLKNQEAARLKIEVTDSDMQDAITDIEKQNHLEPGGFQGFLAKNNFPEDAVRDQIKSQVAWKKIVIEKIRPKISIGENEVQDQIQIMANQSGKKQYDLSEIVLKIDDEKKEDEVKNLAAKLVTELKGGGNFANTAKQFSSDNTAADGGEIGIVAPDKLDKKILKSIEELRIGGISNPIRTEKGYEIFRLNKIKTLVIGDPSESEVTLKQIALALDPKSPADKVAAVEQKMRSISGKITDCKMYEKIAAEMAKSDITFRDYGRLQIKSLATEIRGLVAGLKPGEPSTVLRNGTGLSIFLVCNRKDKEGAEVAIEPDTAQISEMLMGQKIELAARKYMIKLRAEAYIEKRI